MVIYSESITKQIWAYWKQKKILNLHVITNTTVIINSGTCCRRIQFDGAERSNLPTPHSGAITIQFDHMTADRISADSHEAWKVLRPL